MKHIGTWRLETPRLILRRFTREDAQAMYDNWASDAEVTRFLTWPTHTDVSVAEAVLAQWEASYGQDAYYQWAIVPKDGSDAPIGAIAVVSCDDRVQKAELGYCLGRAWWRQGIMTEAARAVIGFLFDEVGVQRVEARHDPRNPHSGAVMRKCGMTFEGTQRRADRNNQGICDVSWYAILREA